MVLRDEGGRPVTVVAGPKARNLEQLRPGDRVSIEHRAALAAEMARPGDPRPPVETLAGGERAPAGERPGGALGQVVRVRVRIDAVDAEAGPVTFTGPAGGTRTVTAQDPKVREFVRNLRPGEQVDLAYSEALAVRVEPAREVARRHAGFDRQERAARSPTSALLPGAGAGNGAAGAARTSAGPALVRTGPIPQHIG